MDPLEKHLALNAQFLLCLMGRDDMALLENNKLGFSETSLSGI
jgi:hypothetical protein